MSPFDVEFLTKCRETTERYEKICGRWAIPDQLNHIHDEVSEVSDVIRNKKEKYGKNGSVEWAQALGDELADVILSTISLVNILKINDMWFNDHIEKKLGVVQFRVKELEQTTEEKEGSP